MFTLRYNGSGPDSTDEVFKPFARIGAGQRPGPGLAVCRVIAERHSGTIRLQREGDDSVFRFTLPAAET